MTKSHKGFLDDGPDSLSNGQVEGRRGDDQTPTSITPPAMAPTPPAAYVPPVVYVPPVAYVPPVVPPVAPVPASLAPVLPTVTLTDTTLGVTTNPDMALYAGPVAGLLDQFIDLNRDNLNITATSSNVFLHSGPGEDALQVASGNNVLDGGTNSNFLVGGTGAGNDTFFADARGSTADIWDTIVNFHSGDGATIWGVTQAGFTFGYTNNEGAVGYTGLTIITSAAGHPNTSLTLPGYTVADLNDGRLAMSFGNDAASGSSYVYVHGN